MSTVTVRWLDPLDSLESAVAGALDVVNGEDPEGTICGDVLHRALSLAELEKPSPRVVERIGAGS